MTRIIAALAAGIATWIIFSQLWVTLITALALLVWRPTPINKTIFVLDNETGEMKVQAHDSAAERYLRDKD